MRIVILSDIHDHISHLRAALHRSQDAEVLICCGDLCSPFIIKELGEGFNGAIHIVFGNNDADLFRITGKASEYDHICLHGEFVELTLGGKKFAVNHFDNISRVIATSNAYDVVCFGHNHQFEISQAGDTLLINPGEIMGELTGDATFVIYDTNRNRATRHDLS